MVDDCSADDSAKIAESYAKRDSRFYLLKQTQNLGVAMARNRALDYIFSALNPQNSDYIGFVDSDDAVARDYFSNLIFALESHKTAMAKSYNIYRFNDKDYKPSFFSYRARKSHGGITRKGGKIEVWRTLYRADFIAPMRFCDARLGEDIIFNNIANARAHKVAYTRSARYFYRQREDSLMKHYRYSFSENFNGFIFMLENFAKFNLLETHKIDISLILNPPSGAENEYFYALQKEIAKYHFSDKIFSQNPSLKAIVDSRDFMEFRAKIKMPFMKRIRRYFQIDIRAYKIYIKLFGRVLCDKKRR